MTEGFISVTSNFRAEDEPVLRYVPYFGEDDETSIDISYYEAVPGEFVFVFFPSLLFDRDIRANPAHNFDDSLPPLPS